MYSKRMVLRYISKRSQDISKTSPTLWEYKGYLFLMFLLNESNWNMLIMWSTSYYFTMQR